MSDLTELIQKLYSDHEKKVEDLKATIGKGITQEAFNDYVQKSKTACELASQKLLNEDLNITFAPFGIDSNSSSSSVKKPRQYERKRKDKLNILSEEERGPHVCPREGCGRSFANAGNLKNHSFVHERRDKMVEDGLIDVDVPLPDNKRKRRKKDQQQALDEDGNVIAVAEEAEEVVVRPKKRVGGASSRVAYSLQEKLEVLAKYDELKETRKYSSMHQTYC